jgi:hypothetical protein
MREKRILQRDNILQKTFTFLSFRIFEHTGTFVEAIAFLEKLRHEVTRGHQLFTDGSTANDNFKIVEAEPLLDHLSNGDKVAAFEKEMHRIFGHPPTQSTFVIVRPTPPLKPIGSPNSIV